MFPEDRVLVSVINRVRDLRYARDEHWYRIPTEQMPQGVNAEYLAFYLSRAFRNQDGGVYYFAQNRGIELVRRADLLPNELSHKHADRLYYRVALGDLQVKDPPILNPSRRPIAFIYTTWDRFILANQIRDLYSDANYYVDRVYYALKQK